MSPVIIAITIALPNTMFLHGFNPGTLSFKIEKALTVAAQTICEFGAARFVRKSFTHRDYWIIKPYPFLEYKENQIDG